MQYENANETISLWLTFWANSYRSSRCTVLIYLFSINSFGFAVNAEEALSKKETVSLLIPCAIVNRTQWRINNIFLAGHFERLHTPHFTASAFINLSRTYDSRRCIGFLLNRSTSWKKKLSSLMLSHWNNGESIRRMKNNLFEMVFFRR